MISTLIISIASCVAMIAVTLIKPRIAFKRISLNTYWLVVSIGAILLLVFQLIKIDQISSALTANTAINPLKILVLFISMTILSIFLDETGFFHYLANAILKKTNSSQLRLFTTFFFAISLLTIFTSNDIIILTFTPFICYFAKHAKVNPVPYLVQEFVAANTASMLLIIGNPTNIYLATAKGIDFISYLKIMVLPTILAIMAAYLIMLLLFSRKLRAPIEKNIIEVKIKNKPLLAVGLFFLSACTILLAISSYIKFEMWLIACCSAGGLIITAIVISLTRTKKSDELFATLKRAPWELIPFIISMFIIILALDEHQITADLASMLGSNRQVFSYGIISTLSANLVNNIPMSVLFSSILQSPGSDIYNVYAVVIGSNIGAYLTPIGALAGIMWLQILKDNKIKFSFLDFIKYGLIIVIPSLFAALLGLYFIA